MVVIIIIVVDIVFVVSLSLKTEFDERVSTFDRRIHLMEEDLCRPGNNSKPTWHLIH